MESKKQPLMALLVLLLMIWSRSSDAQQLEKCGTVSSIMRSCFSALHGGEGVFMKAQSICCRSLEAVERKMDDGEIGRYEICECMKAIGDGDQALLNGNLLEVYALCGPRIPYPISSHSDCTMLMRGTL